MSYRQRYLLRQEKIAKRRLKIEYQQLTQHPIEGITAAPISDENLLEWKVVIKGPPGSCYEGGEFQAKMIFPKSYPVKPPEMQFLSEMFHPNIYRDGRVMIPMLKKCSNIPAENFINAEKWSAARTIESVLKHVAGLLAEPDLDTATNARAAGLWRDDRDRFNTIIEGLVKRNPVRPGP